MLNLFVKYVHFKHKGIAQMFPPEQANSFDTDISLHAGFRFPMIVDMSAQ